MLTFETLASSSAGNAYRLSGGGADKPILIDCGLPYKQLQKSLKFRVSELAACVISHSHRDHCRAATDLLAAGVECLASHETWESIGLRLTESIYRSTIKPQMRVELGDWWATPFEANHDCPGTFGFIIDSPEGDRLLYLTDSNYSRFTFPGLTHIAIECNHSMEILKSNAASGSINQERFERTARTHMSLERLIDMLKANDLSKCKEIHLLHLSDENSDEAAFKRAVEAATGIPTYVAPKSQGGAK